MAKNRICPDCGRSLPEDARGGVCPVCSLQSALKVKSVAGPQVAHATTQGARFPTLNSQPGTRFGDYELLELLARGGMGVVYKARQVTLNRTVALKMIQAGVLASPAEVKRFHAEAEAVAHLQHPNIVAIHEIGEHEGHHYFSMDYVAGRTLAEIVRDGPLPAARAAAYVKTIAAAVHHAHQHGIIHRDLKPANVLIDEHEEPRITDFGLAKRLSDSQFSSLNPQLTLSGQVLGSPNYLPPEQAEPKRGATGPPSDVYSLGAILYHLATGRPPFQAESLTTLLRQVIETEPVAPRSLNPSIPRDLETICLKCLEKETPRRYSTAQELAEDLERFLENKPIQALPVSAAGKAWKWCRRRPALAGLSATLVLTLVAGLTLALWQLQQTRTSELLAKQNAYAADMNLAQVAVESGDLGAAMALLDAHRPAPGQKDLRGWEWRYLWQRCRSDELFELTNSPVTIDQVLFTPDGRWLAARDERSNLRLWDLGSRRQVSTFKMHGYLDPFAFSQKGNLLAYYAAGTPAVSIASLDTQQEIARLAPATHVAHLAFSADASRLFGLDEHGTLTQWDIASTKPLRTLKFPGPQYSLDLLVFSPDASTVVYRLWTGLGLWEPDSGRHTQLKIDGAKSAATVLRFSPDGKWLAAGVGNSDSEVYVWALEDLWRSTEATPPPRVRFGPHRDQISAVAFSSNCGALVSASTDSTLRVWEFGHPKEGRRYQGHRHQVLSVAWSPDGQRIVSSGTDGSVRVWDPRREPALSGPVELSASPVGWSFRLSSDGKTGVAIERTNGAAVLWDMINMRPVEVLHFAGTSNSNVALSPDGRTMAVGDYHGKLTIWDLNTRRALTNLSFGGGLDWISRLPL